MLRGESSYLSATPASLWNSDIQLLASLIKNEENFGRELKSTHWFNRGND